MFTLCQAQGELPYKKKKSIIISISFIPVSGNIILKVPQVQYRVARDDRVSPFYGIMIG